MALRPAPHLHQYRGNRLQTAPTVEPVTLSELKTHLRLTNEAEDSFLSELIGEARQEIEDLYGIAFNTQAWKLTLDHWPMAGEKWWDGMREGHIDEIYAGARHAAVTLPRYPLLSVDTVTVYDEDSNSSTVTIATTFDIDTSQLRGRMALQRGATWPIALRSVGAIEIDYSAGYGASASDVPAPLKRAVRQLAGYLYEHRGDGCEPGDAIRKSGAKTILDRYRVVEV